MQLQSVPHRRARLSELCRLGMPASLWDVCARGGATVCDVPMGWLRACRTDPQPLCTFSASVSPSTCGRRSHVILQNGSSTGRRCEWVGSCPTSLVGVGSARAPSSRSARAATALAARSMRRSAATRGSEDALLSLYIKSGPGLYTHASGPGHPQAWAGRSGEAWGEDSWARGIHADAHQHEKVQPGGQRLAEVQLAAARVEEDGCVIWERMVARLAWACGVRNRSYMCVYLRCRTCVYDVLPRGAPQDDHALHDAL